MIPRCPPGTTTVAAWAAWASNPRSLTTKKPGWHVQPGFLFGDTQPPKNRNNSKLWQINPRDLKKIGLAARLDRAGEGRNAGIATPHQPPHLGKNIPEHPVARPYDRAAAC
jgi:hypothetical protein